MKASANGHAKVVKMLLDKGAIVDLLRKVRQRLILCTGARRLICFVFIGSPTEFAVNPH